MLGRHNPTAWAGTRVLDTTSIRLPIRTFGGGGGASHHVDHLIGLSGRSHRRVHGHGWHVTLDPDTAQATFTRGERTWVTLPRGTRLRRPQPPA